MKFCAPETVAEPDQKITRLQEALVRACMEREEAKIDAAVARRNHAVLNERLHHFQDRARLALGEALDVGQVLEAAGKELEAAARTLIVAVARHLDEQLPFACDNGDQPPEATRELLSAEVEDYRLGLHHGDMDVASTLASLLWGLRCGGTFPSLRTFGRAVEDHRLLLAVVESRKGKVS